MRVLGTKNNFFATDSICEANKTDMERSIEAISSLIWRECGDSIACIENTKTKYPKGFLDRVRQISPNAVSDIRADITGIMVVKGKKELVVAVVDQIHNRYGLARAKEISEILDPYRTFYLATAKLEDPRFYELVSRNGSLLQCVNGKTIYLGRVSLVYNMITNWLPSLKPLYLTC